MIVIDNKKLSPIFMPANRKVTSSTLSIEKPLFVDMRGVPNKATSKSPGVSPQRRPSHGGQRGKVYPLPLHLNPMNSALLFCCISVFVLVVSD